MKSFFATLVIFSSIYAQASSGQALRDDLAMIEKLEKIKQKTTISAQLCDNESMEEYTLFSNRKGEIYALSMESGLYSSTGEEGAFARDRAELINLENCSIKVLKLSK